MHNFTKLIWVAATSAILLRAASSCSRSASPSPGVTPGQATGQVGSNTVASGNQAVVGSSVPISPGSQSAVDLSAAKVAPNIVSGVFGGGPFYNDAATVMPLMRASGFNTMILWTVHVNDNGDLVFNDKLLVADGVYVGSSAWPAQVADLKSSPTSVQRIELSVGSAGTRDFENIAALIAAQGIGNSSILFRNFSALRAAMAAVDAISLDDESAYLPDATVTFGGMLARLGFKISLCPYTQGDFWRRVKTQLNSQQPNTVDRIYLQMYDGGAGNDPAAWNRMFGDLTVQAGLWSRHGHGCYSGDTPTDVAQKLARYKPVLSGGWMWLLDDMLACANVYPVKDYAAAINTGLK